MNSQPEPAALRRDFEQHCRDDSPWPAVDLLIKDLHFAVMSCVRGYLARGIMEENEAKQLAELVQRLRSEARGESAAVQEYVEKALALGESLLRGSPTEPEDHVSHSVPALAPECIPLRETAGGVGGAEP